MITMKPKNLHQRLRELREENELDIKLDALTKKFIRSAKRELATYFERERKGKTWQQVVEDYNKSQQGISSSDMAFKINIS